MLTEVQAEAVEQAGVEVAILRLAAASKLEPGASIKEYACQPPPEKCNVEAWLNKKQKRQQTEIRLGLIAASSAVVIVGSVWELVRF